MATVNVKVVWLSRIVNAICSLYIGGHISCIIVSYDGGVYTATIQALRDPTQISRLMNRR